MDGQKKLCTECEALGYCKAIASVLWEQNHALKLAGLIAQLRREGGDVSANVEKEEVTALTGESLDRLTASTKAVARSKGCPNTHLI